MPRTSRIAANQPGDPAQVIADLRRELVQAQAERDEAVAQQTATAEVLQFINSSPGDLAPVFDAILEKALTLCGATSGGLRTYDGERFHWVASRGETSAFAEFVRNFAKPPSPASGLGRIARGELIVHIGDLA